ncbi:MAG: class I SAM-dependent methyltransferase [Cellulosilyticaceae bacterium]
MSSKEEEMIRAYQLLEDKDGFTKQSLGFKLYNKLAWGIQDEDYVSKVLDMIPDDFRGRLLEIPVGTGFVTCEKYKALTKANIIALDYSEDMLRQAKKLFTENGLINVTCMQGNPRSLHFTDEGFDLVLSMNGFHVFPYKNRAFAEIARVLKYGGIFCGCFYIKGERELTDFVVDRFLVPSEWFTPPFYTKEELYEVLKSYYREVYLDNEKSIVYFKCIK